MALIQCRECGGQVSTKAATCPGCGAAKSKKAGVASWILPAVVAMGLAVAAGIFAPSNEQAKPRSIGESNTVATQSAAGASNSMSGSAGTRVIVGASGSNWVYSEKADKMSGKAVNIARIDAAEPLQFGFPYSGGAQPAIMLRSKGRGAPDVLLMVDRGQFTCGVSGCSVDVKFDDGAPIRFNATEPSDYSSTALFLAPEAKFMRLVKSAKKVNIEATFYQEGSRVMTFDTAGLVWK